MATKDTITGEIYRVQMYDGLGDNILPLGNPASDPLGDQLGYDFAFPENTDAQQQYTLSYGTLTSPTLATNADYLQNSL